MLPSSGTQRPLWPLNLPANSLQTDSRLTWCFYFDKDTTGGCDQPPGEDGMAALRNVARSHLSHYSCLCVLFCRHRGSPPSCQKYQLWAPPFTPPVQTQRPVGCTGKQKIALNSGLTLSRMPFNQPARCSKGPHHCSNRLDLPLRSDHGQGMDGFLLHGQLKERLNQ